jgi:hypothetical protein
MKHLEALLICDGTSDAVLEHPLRWVLSRSGWNPLKWFTAVPQAGHEEP